MAKTVAKIDSELDKVNEKLKDLTEKKKQLERERKNAEYDELFGAYEKSKLPREELMILLSAPEGDIQVFIEQIKSKTVTAPTKTEKESINE